MSERRSEEGEVVTVEVESLAPGGDAVGRQVGGAAEGRVTFVPFAAPGERVRARLVRVKARVAFAELVEVERAAPERVRPPCPLFGTCGGCQWQHVTHPVQIAAKRAIVGRALGIDDVEIRAPVPEYGYRSRARVVVGAGSQGTKTVGFRGRRSHDVVDVPDCLLLVDPLRAAWPALREAARQLPTGAEVPVQTSGDDESAAVVGVLGGRPWAWRRAAGSNAPAPGSIDVAEPGSPPLVIEPGAFAQVGPEANRALVEAVLEAVGPAPGRMLELYAGSGNFTRHLVARAEGVVANDGDPAAMDAGRRNVPEADWRRTVAGSDAKAARTVLVDPPREGLDARHLELAGLAAERLVYVSCDPQTLARDATRLSAAGLRLRRAVALDLMPQTFHVEVVATFERS